MPAQKFSIHPTKVFGKNKNKRRGRDNRTEFHGEACVTKFAMGKTDAEAMTRESIVFEKLDGRSNHK